MKFPLRQIIHIQNIMKQGWPMSCPSHTETHKGKDYWQPLVDFVDRMAEEGTISPEDPNIIFFTDEVEEAVAHLQRHAVRQFGLRRQRLPKPSPLLDEQSLARR